MQFFSDHVLALGDSRRQRVKKIVVTYGASSCIALLCWGAWDTSVSAGALNVIATVQSVVATVLLTVMGSIYSGLPSAVRRARSSRARARAPSTRVVATTDAGLVDRDRQPRIRAEFEETRLEVLRGLFSHTAVAVVYALISLPIIVAAVQLGEYTQTAGADLARLVAPWFALAVLVTASWTITVVYLVLVQIHRLVLVDSNDPDPPAES